MNGLDCPSYPCALAKRRTLVVQPVVSHMYEVPIKRKLFVCRYISMTRVYSSVLHVRNSLDISFEFCVSFTKYFPSSHSHCYCSEQEFKFAGINEHCVATKYNCE